MNKFIFFFILLGVNMPGFSQSVNYDITNSLPTFDKNPGNLNVTNADYYYRDTGITITSAGTYTFTLNTGDNLDSWMIIYDKFGFNSEYPLINELMGNDDDPEGRLGVGSRIVINLMPGLYTIVGTTYNLKDIGTATLTISGPAPVSFGPHPGITQLINYSINNSLPIFTYQGEKRYYLDTGIRINTEGLYNFQLNTNNGLNSFAFLSNANGFDAANAMGNLIVTNDDDSLGYLASGSRIVVNLKPGDYVFVGTTVHALDQGFANLAVSGPEPVVLVPPFNNTILPLHLLNFTVKSSKEGAQFNWTALEDGEGGHYLLQRSDDGMHFIDQQSVTAGKKPLIVSYQAYDNNPMRGQNFYRLAVVNREGSLTFSKLLKLDVGEAQFIETVDYPNPSVGSIHVHIKNMKDRAVEISIQVTDIIGHIISSEKKVLGKQSDFVYPSKPGLYILRVTSADGNYTWSRHVLVH